MKQDQFSDVVSSLVSQFSKKVESYNWEDEAFYKLWIAQTHEFVQRSSSFLDLCYNGLAASHPLKQRFKDHINEEAGHEKMSQNDMKFMKASQEQVFPVSQIFWRNQFYWIKEQAPSSHLGYIILLEGLAALAGPQILARIKAAGHKGFTFLKVHAEEDQDHFTDALESTEPLTESERAAVLENLKESLYLYDQMIQQCAQMSYQPMRISA